MCRDSFAGVRCRVDPFALRFEHPRHWILREPVDLEVGIQLAQLSSDGNVALSMAQPDR